MQQHIDNHCGLASPLSRANDLQLQHPKYMSAQLKKLVYTSTLTFNYTILSPIPLSSHSHQHSFIHSSSYHVLQKEEERRDIFVMQKDLPI